MEYVNGLVYANEWHSDIMHIIDPKTGEEFAILEFNRYPEDLLGVFNGIAYNKKMGEVYLTGKNWEKVYVIKLDEKPLEMTICT